MTHGLLVPIQHVLFGEEPHAVHQGDLRKASLGEERAKVRVQGHGKVSVCEFQKRGGGGCAPLQWAARGPRRGRRRWSSDHTRCRSGSSSAAPQRGLGTDRRAALQPGERAPAWHTPPFALLLPQSAGCLGDGVSGLLRSGKGVEKAGPPPLLHSPPIRLSSRSRYFRHICRPFSSSLGTGGRQRVRAQHVEGSGDPNP